MEWHQRVQMIRRYGPRRPILRQVLEWFASYDTDAGRWIHSGKLVPETGLSKRSSAKARADLVRMGWLTPEKAPRADSRTAAWAHGHTGGCREGGRGNSPLYRIIYQAQPAAEPPRAGGRHAARSMHGGPPEVCTGGRPGEPTPDTSVHGGPTGVHGGQDEYAPRAHHPESIQYIQDGGGTPPYPPEGGEAGASPQGAGAPVWSAAARLEILKACKRGGCFITQPSDEAGWESILQEIGVTEACEVPRVIYDLAKGRQTTFPQDPIARPYTAPDLAPWIAKARASLDARRAFTARVINQPKDATA